MPEYFRAWLTDLAALLQNKAAWADKRSQEGNLVERTRALGAAAAYREIHDYVDTALRHWKFRPDYERRPPGDDC